MSLWHYHRFCKVTGHVVSYAEQRRKKKMHCLGVVKLKNDVISLPPSALSQLILRPAVRSAESVFSEVC